MDRGSDEDSDTAEKSLAGPVQGQEGPSLDFFTTLLTNLTPHAT